MTAVAKAELDIAADPETLARRVADWLLALAVARDGAFALALSGGATPRRLYQLLAEPPYRESFPWQRVHLFWGDERFVPHDDAASNFRMVREAMLTRVPVPAANVHPIPTEGLTPPEAARRYQHALQVFYGAQRLDPARPLFDVTLLGLGADGHTASLFPGSAALDEREGWVTAVPAAIPRVTLTYPALESSRHVAFLVAGEEKRSIFSRFWRGDQSLPAARVQPVGTLHVFTDAAAAGGVERPGRQQARPCP